MASTEAFFRYFYWIFPDALVSLSRVKENKKKRRATSTTFVFFCLQQFASFFIWPLVWPVPSSIGFCFFLLLLFGFRIRPRRVVDSVGRCRRCFFDWIWFYFLKIWWFWSREDRFGRFFFFLLFGPVKLRKKTRRSFFGSVSFFFAWADFRGPLPRWIITRCKRNGKKIKRKPFKGKRIVDLSRPRPIPTQGNSRKPGKTR